MVRIALTAGKRKSWESSTVFYPLNTAVIGVIKRMVIRRPEPKKYYKRSDIIDHSVKVWIDGRLVARLEPVYTSESLAPAWRFKPEVSWLSPKEFNDLGELFEELIQKAEEAFRVVAYWPVFLDKKG